MSALVDLPKHEICERLIKIIQDQEKEINKLKQEKAEAIAAFAAARATAHWYETKIAHGCSDAHCDECDGPFSHDKDYPNG